MSTQQFAPQPGAPPTRSPKFNPTNVPEIVALAIIPGEMSESQFGPSEVRFRLTDGRTWYVPRIVADEIYRERFYEEDAQHEAAEEGRKFRRRPMMPPHYIDPETGCTAAEIKEEETGWACPIVRELCDGVRTRRPLREDAVCPKGKVA